jgi:hypothetical protein
VGIRALAASIKWLGREADKLPLSNDKELHNMMLNKAHWKFCFILLLLSEFE